MVDDRALLIGATASDPRSSVPIWNAIRKYLTEAGFPVEYALYSTYDAMCAGLLDGQVDIAWNAPMAHAQSLIQSNGECRDACHARYRQRPPHCHRHSHRVRYH